LVVLRTRNPPDDLQLEAHSEYGGPPTVCERTVPDASPSTQPPSALVERNSWDEHEDIGAEHLHGRVRGGLSDTVATRSQILDAIDARPLEL
jgi:hypothetical protein